MKIAGMIVLCLMLMSCAIPQHNALITDYERSGSPNFHHRVTADKNGDACAENVLGIYKWGEATVDRAMKNAGIDMVRTVDYSELNVLFLYDKHCVKITGGSILPADTGNLSYFDRRLKQIELQRELGIYSNSEYVYQKNKLLSEHIK